MLASETYLPLLGTGLLRYVDLLQLGVTRQQFPILAALGLAVKASPAG